MLNKKLPSYITIALIVLAAWGIFNNLYITIDGETSSYIKTSFSLVNLGLVFTRGFLGYEGLNYANAIFYMILLLGGIFSLASSGRETRLLRTAIGVVFISNIVSLLSGISFLFFIKPMIPYTAKIIVINLLYYIKFIALAYGSYRLLKYYNQSKELDLEVYEHNDTVTAYSIAAGRGQRLTHTLLDGLITVFVFSPAFDYLFFQLSRNPDSVFSRVEEGRPLLLFIFALCRIVYYVIFEWLLAATPAKMMTETRVLDTNGDEPRLPAVLGRTMARLIPLEGLSFLANAGGWHDRFSSTSVVQEKRTGASGGYYYFIPVVIAFLFGASTLIKANLAERSRINQYAEEKRLFNENLRQKLDHAGTNDFFALERVNVSDGSGNGTPMSKFLKVEKLTADSIAFTVVKAYGHGYADPGQRDAELAYLGGKDTLRHVTYARADLQKGLAIKSENPSADNEAPKGIVENGYRYNIKSIETYFQPNVKLSESHGYGHNYLNIGIENTGWPAEITKIDVLEGDAKMTSPLPLQLMTSQRGINSRIIEGDVDGDEVDFKLNITVQDTTGRIQVYQISGNTKEDGSRSMKRLK